MMRKLHFLAVAALVSLFSPQRAAAAAGGGNTCEVEAQVSPLTFEKSVGERVQLNANSSKDAKLFSWRQIAGSPAVTLDDTTSEKPQFTVPDVGAAGATLVFEVTVSGCTPLQTDTATQTVIVSSVNAPPVVSATVSPTSVYEGEPVLLDASASTDPNGDQLTFLWERIDAAGTVTVVGNAATVTTSAPMGVPYPAGASFTYRLTVSDGRLSAPPFTKSVTVKWFNDPPVAVANCPATVNERENVTLDGAGSYDDEDGIVSYRWTHLTGGPDSDLPAEALSLPALAFEVPSLDSTFDAMTFKLVVTDAGGLFDDADCTITVLDVTAPVISGAVDRTVEAESAAGTAVTFGPTAFDAVEGVRDVTCDPPSGTTFPLGTTAVTCRAEDTKHNEALATLSVSVVDTTPPDITAPSGIVEEATGPRGATVEYEASAEDIVDGSLSPICTPASGSQFALGATTVECTATDKHGNEASETFQVTVRDTTPPTLTVPANKTAEATGPDGAAVTFSATATDVVDGAVVPVCTPAPGSTFALGTTTVKCIASDSHANASEEQSFTVTVQDTTPPALVLPANQTAEATGPSGAMVNYTASARDLVDGDVEPGCSPASGSTFALGATTVSCTATDSHGNGSTSTFTVTVVDTTPPAVTPPSNVTMGPTNAAGAKVPFGSATATDLVDGALAATCSPEANTQFAFGTTTVTCSATDAHGNTGLGTFTVTVTGFTFLGFFQPIDNLPVMNTVKNGSTVPVKWRLLGDQGVAITDIAAIDQAKMKVVQIPCANETVESVIDVTTTGGTSLRYDTTGAQFILNWQTPKQPGTCWSLEVPFKDGNKRTANFKLK